MFRLVRIELVMSQRAPNDLMHLFFFSSSFLIAASLIYNCVMNDVLITEFSHIWRLFLFSGGPLFASLRHGCFCVYLLWKTFGDKKIGRRGEGGIGVSQLLCHVQHIKGIGIPHCCPRNKCRWVWSIFYTPDNRGSKRLEPKQPIDRSINHSVFWPTNQSSN